MIFRHQNADGGNASDGGNQNLSGGDPQANAAGANAGQGAGSDKEPVTQAQYEELKASYAKLETEHKARGETLGKQSTELGDLRKLKESLSKADAKTLLSQLAVARGVKVKFEDDQASAGDDGLAAALASGDQKAITEALTRRDQNVRSQTANDVRKEILPTLAVLREGTMSAKYKDWEPLAPIREETKIALATGLISQDEIMHYAARGMKADELANASYAKGRADEQAEIVAQVRTMHKAPGAREAGGQGGPTDKEKTENVLTWINQRQQPVNR